MRQLQYLVTLLNRTTAIRQILAIAPRASAVVAVALVVSGFALGPATALATPIDEFTETTITGLDVIAPSLTIHVAPGLASVAGGVRTTELDVDFASGIANNVAFAIDPSGGGQAMYASGPTAYAKGPMPADDGHLSLLYDGADLALDLGLAVIAIKINFVVFDDGFDLDMDVTVIVSDGPNMADLTIPVTASSFTPFTLDFPLNSFNGIGAVNPGNLTSIEVVFEAMQGQDFMLDSIHALVPEPAAFSLFALGSAIFVGAYGRRRRR